MGLKTKRKNKPGAGRPRGRELDDKEKDWVKVCVGLGATIDEVARALKMPKRSLQRNYGTLLKSARPDFELKLRQKIAQLALNGHPTMLIFLAKTRLGFRENLGIYNVIPGFQFVEDKE